MSAAPGAARLWGVLGHPYLDVSPLIDTSVFPVLDAELTRGLTRATTNATGGTLKWMGVVAPWVIDDGFRDAMFAIEAMSPDELREFAALGDGPPVLVEDRATWRFGDETDRPFTAAQVRLLSTRYGAYFPWKVCLHLLENERWEDKHSGAGKAFTAEALALFPETVRFVQSLPFTEIGRVVLFGLEPDDHAPLHRDTEPGRALQVAQSLCFQPRPGKRLYLQNAPEAAPTIVDAPLYWFNDMDYHGVLSDPVFRYSVRVDGVFDRDFVRSIERHARSQATP